MTKELYVQGAIPEFEHDGDENDWRDLSLRSLSFGIHQPFDSLVFLPDTPETVEYVDQLEAIVHSLGRNTPHRVLIPKTSYFLDISIAQHLSVLEKHLSQDEEYTVRPYANTGNLDGWMSLLADRGYKVSTPYGSRVYFENLNHPQHRGSWTGRLSDSQSDGRGSNGYFPKRYGIPYPTSYMGIGLDEVLEARRRVVEESGIETVYAKLLFGAGGFGVAKISSDKELIQYYEVVRQSGALMLFGQEQPFEIQAEIQDVIAFASLQFIGSTITTPGVLTVQHVENNNWKGNGFNLDLVRPCVEEARKIFRNIHQGLIAETGVAGGGGIDFAIVQGEDRPRLVMVEPNIDRVVGADPAIALAHAFGVVDKPFLVRRMPEPNCDLETFWKTLSCEGLDFDPSTKSGIFPILWVEGSGYIFAVADSGSQLEKLINQATNLMYTNGYLK